MLIEKKLIKLIALFVKSKYSISIKFTDIECYSLAVFNYFSGSICSSISKELGLSC